MSEDLHPSGCLAINPQRCCVFYKIDISVMFCAKIQNSKPLKSGLITYFKEHSTFHHILYFVCTIITALRWCLKANTAPVFASCCITLSTFYLVLYFPYMRAAVLNYNLYNSLVPSEDIY